MAKRSRESFQKRARERARQEKQAEKRAKRQSDSADDGPTRAMEDSLMQQFAALSARYEADQISAERYNEERQRIFAELGLESDD